MATNPRTPFFVDVGNNKVVMLNIPKASYTGDLTTDLGYTERTAPGYEVPAGKTLFGKSRLAAMQNGCFGVNLVYQATSTKNQTAKVLCSPGKSDSIFTDARTDTYRGKNIIEVRISRRRIYTF